MRAANQDRLRNCFDQLRTGAIPEQVANEHQQEKLTRLLSKVDQLIRALETNRDDKQRTLVDLINRIKEIHLQDPTQGELDQLTGFIGRLKEVSQNLTRAIDETREQLQVQRGQIRDLNVELRDLIELLKHAKSGQATNRAVAAVGEKFTHIAYHEGKNR